MRIRPLLILPSRDAKPTAGKGLFVVSYCPAVMPRPVVRRYVTRHGGVGLTCAIWMRHPVTNDLPNRIGARELQLTHDASDELPCSTSTTRRSTISAKPTSTPISARDQRLATPSETSSNGAPAPGSHPGRPPRHPRRTRGGAHGHLPSHQQATATIEREPTIPRPGHHHRFSRLRRTLPMLGVASGT